MSSGRLQMVKFADDTYIIFPAVNANSRQSELINFESWSRVNNLRVNPAKYAEIVFMDRRKTTVQLPCTADAKRSPCLSYLYLE